jgi:hypothetical protein
MFGIAPIVYPSIRCGGPGAVDLMVIDQPRAMSATLPSKRTGDAFTAAVMPTDCPLGAPSAGAAAATDQRWPKRHCAGAHRADRDRDEPRSVVVGFGW